MASARPGFLAPATRSVFASSPRGFPPASLSSRRPTLFSRFSMATTAPNFEGRSVLVVKAAPDGSLGNCPFSQKANLALRLRGVPFEVETVHLDNKPKWFLDLTEKATAPVFVDGKLVLKESDDIVQHADKVGKQGSMLVDDANPRAKSAKKCMEPVLKAFARLVMNEGDDGPLTAELDTALEAVASHLKDGSGKFVLGDKFSSIDCELAPKLWHVQVAGKRIKGVEMPERLTQYLSDVQRLAVWAPTACPDDVLVDGWEKHLPVRA